MNKKIKLFLAKDYLDWREAVEMFCYLTETEATPSDFVALARKYQTPVYSYSYPNGLPSEYTYHEDSPSFLAYGSYSEKEAAIYCDFGSGDSVWDNEGIIHSNLAHFKPTDIKNLAAQINDNHSDKQQNQSLENSALLLIGRALELYLQGGNNRNQDRFVHDIIEENKLYGLSERTIKGWLSKANKTLDEARKK